MRREFTPEVVSQVLHGPYLPHIHRSPLHVQFLEKEADDEFASASVMEVGYGTANPDFFNAIGSKIVGSTDKRHLPVIDVDGGAVLQSVNDGGKVIIRANPSRRNDKRELHGYGPRCLLRDVLGDYGIDVEVFQEPRQAYAKMLGSYRVMGQEVTALVLRAAADVFDTVDSTQEGHSHLYLQREFSDGDHQTLINELGNLGIISARWQAIVEDEGMGVVRTPWTEKAITHRSS